MELGNYLAPCFAPEATLHCTLPWTNPRHETRRLLFRYTPKYLHVDGGTFTTTQPAWVDELTDVQRAVLEPPYTYGRPEISNDGQRVISPTSRATPDGRNNLFQNKEGNNATMPKKKEG